MLQLHDIKQPDPIESTIMAIRENLMDYFKGTCVNYVTHSSNVYMSGERTRARHNYERELYQQQSPCVLYIHDTPILSVRKTPDTLILHEVVLGRSKQLQAVREAVEAFMAKYLQGVRIDVNRTTKIANKVTVKRTKEKDDSYLFTGRPRERESTGPAASFDKQSLYYERIMQQEGQQVPTQMPPVIYPTRSATVTMSNEVWRASRNLFIDESFDDMPF